MVKIIRAALTVGLLLCSKAAFPGVITGSAHDFSTGASAAWSGGKICIACHTPHKSDTSVVDAPLWNHANSTASYTLYSSPTLDAQNLNLGGNSKLCLSCHDGTVAVNSFGGTTGSVMISSVNNLGNNLKDDHPIGFIYDTTLATKDGSLWDPSASARTVTIGSGSQVKTGTIAAVMLFNGKMECSSCHDVHNTFTVGGAGTGLVKMDSAGSKLCLACHNK